MSTSHPANIDLAAALAEAQEQYRARNPKSLAHARGGLRRPARRQHPLGDLCRAVPADDGPGRRRASVGRRRPRIRRFPQRIHRRHFRPFAPGDPPRPRRGARRRLEHGRARPRRGALRRGDLRPLPVDRSGALHQQRHRGQSDGGRARRARSPAATKSWCSRAAITAASFISAARAARSTRPTTSWSRATTTAPRTRALVAPHRDDLAAILIEPMLGGSGCIPADARLPRRSARAGRARPARS